MAIDCIAEIPGAVELSNWFGGFPSFADARAELSLTTAAGHLRISSFGLVAGGAYDPRKPFVATIRFGQILSVSLADFADFIHLDDLSIKKTAAGYEVCWESAYGAQGSISCKMLRIDMETPSESRA